MLHIQHVHMNTVNSQALHSQFDFFFRFLLLHILAQGERIESVLFQPILAAYPTRHSWIISTHINLGTLHKSMHMFNRQTNIVRETISKLRNHPDDTIEPLQPFQVKLDNLYSLFIAYNQYFHPLEAYSKHSRCLMENPYLHREGRNEVFYLSLAQHLSC